ncbi:MAG: chemotaxis protein CheW [Deltaproteobacteria bacterium]|nr:chemotaxis protein CheW [Deltaproteobacteria bacterium]
MSLHVLFKVGDSDYVVPAAAVMQMDSFTGATPVPGAPPYVRGIVQIRGRVIPVVDLRTRFGLPPIERTLDARIIVVRAGDRHVGLLADSAREVLVIADDQFSPPPDIVVEQSRGFVNAIAHAGKRIVMRLRFESVVTPDVIAVQEQSHGHKA